MYLIVDKSRHLRECSHVVFRVKKGICILLKNRKQCYTIVGKKMYRSILKSVGY